MTAAAACVRFSVDCNSFSDLQANPRLFITAQAVLRSYETSRLYRELKMRGAIIKDKQLILLPGEKVRSG